MKTKRLRRKHYTTTKYRNEKVRDFVKQISIVKFKLVCAIGNLYRNGKQEREIYKTINNDFGDGLISCYLRQYAKVTIMIIHGCDNESHILYSEFLLEMLKLKKAWKICYRYIYKLVQKGKFG